jgi:hypothetical protein
VNRTVIALLLLLLVAYGVWKAYPMLSGPTIVITAPDPFTAIPGGELTLVGTALRTDTLMLNDAVLLIDEKGHFETSLTLPPGGAILSLTARDRFDRSVTKRITVYSSK